VVILQNSLMNSILFSEYYILQILSSSYVETFNINYLDYNAKRVQLDNILSRFNLTSIISFPTRVQKNSVSATDNIFVDISSIGKFTIKPKYNGLPNHNAQMLLLNDIHLCTKINTSKTVRNVFLISLFN
jgi:hypothetical protein